MDKIKVWWEELPEEVDIIMWSPRRWVAYVSCGDRRLCLFGATNRTEFFRRYNAITVEKAPPEEVTDHG